MRGLRMQRALDSQHVDVCLERFKRIDILRNAHAEVADEEAQRVEARLRCHPLRCSRIASVAAGGPRAPAAATRERGM